MANAERTRKSIGKPLPHDSAALHVRGSARYIDDLPVPADCLHLFVGQSQHAHARIVRADFSAAEKAPGVACVLRAGSVPGVNDVGPMIHDDPLFADGLVEYVGQPVFAIAADSLEAARKAATLVELEYETLDPIIDIETALARGHHVLPEKTLERGDVDSAMAESPHRLSGGLAIGGQEHFYLEGQAALAMPGEAGCVTVHSSTQHPSEVQHAVAHVLGLPGSKVTTKVRRMGGAFGGKETQGAGFAAMAALAATITGRATKIVLDRDDDMRITGKRHAFATSFEVGFDDKGVILALDARLASRCGRSADLSGPVNDRAMFHVDNCCYLENVRINSARLKTHTPSDTAFRGFGGPQGMMVIEEVLDRIARCLRLDPLDVRKRNLYGNKSRNQTPYGMEVFDNILPELFRELEESTEYRARRKQVEKFNAKHRWLKKGLALTGVKFGISFTTTFLNQGGALVHIYSDGSIHLNHGGTEMGQGLFVKVQQVVAEEFHLDPEHISITATSTGKVPNTSATAASSGSDINGKAAQNAARKLKRRLVQFAAGKWAVEKSSVRFLDNQVHVGDEVMPFAKFVNLAYLDRVPLSATGFYRTPKIAYDGTTGKGRPFYYFAYGVALSEVVVDTLTGENRLDRVDILHDVGDSLNPAVDLGQIEGGFIQGMGWLTTEELVFRDDGSLATHAPSTYKIPTAGDRPTAFHITLKRDNPNREDAIFRSKAVGEPPLMLAISVFRAISDALSYLSPDRAMPPLNAPATPENVLRAVEGLTEP